MEDGGTAGISQNVITRHTNVVLLQSSNFKTSGTLKIVTAWEICDDSGLVMKFVIFAQLQGHGLHPFTMKS